jgi:putrescine transport system ATP-binding protein
VEIAVRPEKIRLSAEPPPDPNAVRGRIENVVYLGAVTFYYLGLAGGLRLVVMAQNQAVSPGGGGLAVGEAVYAGWDAASALPLRGAPDERPPAREP